MEIKKNVGELDRLLRISMGLSILGHGIAKKSSLPIAYGSIKVAEGIIGFCFLYHFLGLNTLDNKLDISGMEGLKHFN